MLAAFAVAVSATAAVAAPQHHHGRGPGRAGHAAAPSDAQIARRTIARYFRFLDEGRGAEFCSQAISAATLRAQGGLYRCAAKMSGYVRGLERQSFGATLQNLHILFSMVSDGIGIHCDLTGPCPSSRYGRWAQQSAPNSVRWRTAVDPRLATSTSTKVVAVVDPLQSSPSWITLYYQAWDGRILRASWSTETGSWKGSVVDTHTGTPFVSLLGTANVSRSGPQTMVVHARIRVGTEPSQLEEFRLVQEGTGWRADTWRTVAGPPAV